MKHFTIRKERCTLKMQEISTPTTYPISTLSAQDSLARVFQLLENGEDLTTQEELSSLKLPELPPLKELRFYSLRTSKTSFRMTKDGHLRPSSKSWMTSGMMSHGRCLTARISSSPNPEIECSLQDFLEADVPGKYLLSAKQTLKLLSKDCPDAKVTEFTQQTGSV